MMLCCSVVVLCYVIKSAMLWGIATSLYGTAGVFKTNKPFISTAEVFNMSEFVYKYSLQ